MRHDTEAATADDGSEVGTDAWNASHRVPISALGNIGGSVTLDVDDNADIYFHGTATSDITDITISNATSGRLHSFTWEITQDGTGSRTITYPAAWKFTSEDPDPALSTAAGAVDILTGWTRDGGTTVYAAMSHKAAA